MNLGDGVGNFPEINEFFYLWVSCVFVVLRTIPTNSIESGLDKRIRIGTIVPTFLFVVIGLIEGYFDLVEVGLGI